MTVDEAIAVGVRLDTAIMALVEAVKVVDRPARDGAEEFALRRLRMTLATAQKTRRWCDRFIAHEMKRAERVADLS